MALIRQIFSSKIPNSTEMHMPQIPMFFYFTTPRLLGRSVQKGT